MDNGKILNISVYIFKIITSICVFTGYVWVLCLLIDSFTTLKLYLEGGYHGR